MIVDLGNLLSGAAGAFLVAVFTVFYTEVREARGAVRELAGLARLLADEVERNERIVKVLPPSAETIDMYREILRVDVAKPPAVDAWVETRGRLAQGLEHGDFEAVADYYQIVYGLAMNLKAAGHTITSSAWPIPREAPSWQERTEDVEKHLRRYASPGWRKEHLGF